MVAIFADADKMKFRFFLFIFFLLTIFPGTAPALEYLRFIHQKRDISEEGRIVLEAQEEGIVFEARDGQLYVISTGNIIARRQDDIPFEPYTKTEMIGRLEKEFPKSEGYQYLDMFDPFIVIYTTSRPFANWQGRLMEKLYTQYVSFWKRHGVELTQPEFPMVAIVLSNEGHFRQYASQEGILLSARQCAFYHRLTNRIVLYDMSGLSALQEQNGRPVTPADIERFVKHRNSHFHITTVIHEATHQVGFNTGMHSRYMLEPLWIREGLAVFHEVPDQRNSLGWTTGPHVNLPRLEQLRKFLEKPQQQSPIQNMIQDDELLKNEKTAPDNYALAWGVVYYLEKKRPKELAEYLKLFQKKDFESDDIDEVQMKDIRMKDFESCFGCDWGGFYKDFYDFLRRLR